ncbi:MAG TPA: TadE family protein [Candidatus Binatia bacterium]|nr:TadE family protein [Candidatus Binatia bacterium]
MKRALRVVRALAALRRFSWPDDRAAQLVEFAVSLPLLVVFVVGIFDFSGAFTLKQKLTNVARDAARAAAADPAGDLSSSSPIAVNDAFQIIHNYFVGNQLNDCGITQSTSPSNLKWTSTATGNGCSSGGLRIIINRGYYFPLTGGTPPTVDCTSQAPGTGVGTLIGTCISIRYAYPWRFGRAASLLGRSTNLPDISAVGVALNEN